MEEEAIQNRIYHRSSMQIEKSQPEGKRMMPETRFTERTEVDNKVCVLCITRNSTYAFV